MIVSGSVRSSVGSMPVVASTSLLCAPQALSASSSVSTASSRQSRFLRVMFVRSFPYSSYAFRHTSKLRIPGFQIFVKRTSRKKTQETSSVSCVGIHFSGTISIQYPSGSSMK